MQRLPILPMRCHPERSRCHPERNEGPMHLACDNRMRRFFAPLRGASLLAVFEKWHLWDTQGAALLEFAVALPLLVVFVVGIYDFSGAFNQKQKIEQAAQEGAILAASEPMDDIGKGNPPSVHAAVTAIFNSLAASGILQNANTGTCKSPGKVSGPANLVWTYTISGCNSTQGSDDLVITINRGWTSTSTTPAAVGTVVTVQYTYYWQFNSIIQLLFPGSNSYSATTNLTESATVHNQT